MKRWQLNNREQFWAALVIIALLAGSYALFRGWPVYQRIEGLEKAMRATEQRLLKTVIPEEPTEDLAALERRLADRERAMDLLRDEAQALEQRLAPFDSQAMIVAISRLARKRQLRVRVNEALAVKAVAAKPSNKKKSKRRSKTIKDAQPVLLPETAGWIARVSPGTLLHRPLRRIELEGSFRAIRHFIHDLQQLPYQVTVLRLKIVQLPTPAPAGYPQLLLGELVLAL